jgi:hypothetical protein
MTTYTETLSSYNGAPQYFAIDLATATSQVQLQNLSDTPLTFIWGSSHAGQILRSVQGGHGPDKRH